MKFNLEHYSQKFFRLPVVGSVVSWAKSHSLPGFFKVPIYDVILFVMYESRRFAIITRANAIAFSFFLSLFPALMALFTLLPYFQNLFTFFIPEGENFNFVLKGQIMRIMPGEAGRNLSNFILDIVNNPRLGLSSFGLLLALIFASNGMMAMMRSFEKSYEPTFIRRNRLKKRLVAFEMILILGIMILSSVLLVILGDWFIGVIAGYFNADAITTASLFILRWVVMISLFYFGISFLYRLGASTKKTFDWFTPGATLATLMSIIASLGFSIFVEQFGAYNKLYGSIGTFIVLMLWIQINSFSILVGYELNASIAVNRDLKKFPKPSRR